MTPEGNKMEQLTKKDGQSMDIVEQNIDQLKELFPDVFSEGKIQFDKLQALLGNHVTEEEDNYNFSWHGKLKAGRLAQTPSTGTLRPCKEESIDWDSTQNLFIEGDNLEVLKLLQKSYHRQVKMIYIDPPYNTGNDFVYKDDFKDGVKNYLEMTGQLDGEGKKSGTNSSSAGRYHTNWLNMMYPRLKLARNLLRDDGVIFISIDDNEQANLIKLGDDVFGEENYVGLLSVENNPKGRKNSRFISVSNDYCVIYAKNKEIASFVENIPKSAGDMKEDENGNFVHNSGKRVLVGENSFNNAVTNFASEKHYSVYYNDKTNHIIFEQKIGLEEVNQELISNGYKRYVSTRNNSFIENTYTKTKLEELFKAGALEFKSDKIFEKNYSSSIRIKSILTNKEYEAIVNGEKINYKLDVKTTSAGTHIKELFRTKDTVFPAPKNIGLLKTLITLLDNDILVLDFFCGSATTAHAVMTINAERGMNNKYVLVQIPEVCEEKTEAFKAGFLNISQLAKERIRLSAKQVKEENPDYKGDLGFKAFKLDTSNIKRWEADFDTLEEDLLAGADYIKQDRSSEDILYELLLKYGLDLTVPIETRTIAGKTVYSIGLGALVVCLDKDVSMDLVNGVGALKEELQPEIMRVVFTDNGFKDDVVKTNAMQTLKRFGIEDIKSL
jgi:adenine-specific DNA-methyltransferase